MEHHQYSVNAYNIPIVSLAYKFIDIMFANNNYIIANSNAVLNLNIYEQINIKISINDINTILIENDTGLYKNITEISGELYNKIIPELTPQ